MNMLDNYPDKMIGILEKKKLLLADMLTLTEAQASEIKTDRLDKLQRLVEEKQRKIDEIDKLDEKFELYMEKLKKAAGIERLEDMDTSTLPQAGMLKEITGEILALVSRISEAEKVNGEKCKELLEQLGARIKKINQGKKISSAYNSAAADTSSFFVDKKR